MKKKPTPAATWTLPGGHESLEDAACILRGMHCTIQFSRNSDEQWFVTIAPTNAVFWAGEPERVFSGKTLSEAWEKAVGAVRECI